MTRPLKKVLVANRGEIAVRVLRALREAGLASVAVHSEADAGALHVRLADESVPIGPARAAESYLSIERVLEAARLTGADAVHPGYGFLSENADFVRACERAGLTFIGPGADAMHAMGDKARARAIAEKAGVPVIPGRPDPGDAGLVQVAEDVGYPLLLKPSAGGGGKGMVEVHGPDELLEKAVAARRVAKAAFGDETLLVERLVRPARHVEIQVFGDAHGEVVALGERECSLQRRHQKVVEECPSPALGETARAAMCEAAVALARSVGYVGAGTVEFLLGPDQSFYFLEMNTRLQVEHPVTEMVFGVDLVRAQLAVAAGEPLPAALREARPRGAAIEVRLYAEDPARGFLPAPGRLLALSVPHAPGLRLDAAFDGPGAVGSDYDPMIAKLIAWGPDRETARARLLAGLRATAVVGLTTNAGFLARVLEDPRFVAGDFATSSLEAWMEEEGFLERPHPDDAALIAALLGFAARPGAGARPAGGAPADADVHAPFVAAGGWRLMEGPR